MKKVIFVIIFVLKSLVFFAQVPNYVPSNGLVGWWPFTGNAIDSSSNGNNGTVNGAGLTTDRFGRSNQAYSFNGSSYISAGTNFSPTGNSEATLNAWFYTSSTPGSPVYIVCTGHPTNLSQTFGMGEYGSSGLFSTFSGSQYDVISGTPAPRNAWHMMTAVHYKNGQVKLFLDGNLFYSSTVSSPSFNFTNTRIGDAVWGVSKWNGKIDDVGIWSRALADCEIKRLYQSQSNTIPSLTIGKDTNICKLDSFKLTASTGFKTYLWSTNDTSKSIYIKSSCKVSVIATDSFGCKSYDTATISLLNPKIIPRDTIVCKGSQVTLRSKVNSSTSNTTCGYMPNALKTGLVAWYPFCGNANDASGNGNNGTVYGPILTADRNGIQNSAYIFDGINDYIQTSGNGPTGTGISVSYWFKSTQTSFYGSVLGFGGNSAGSKFEILHDYWAAGQGPCSGPAIHSSFSLFSPGTGVSKNNGAWHHAVVILPTNASSLNQTIFYVDGVKLSNSCSYANYGAPAPSIGTGNTIKFGMIHTNMGTSFYQGALDDIGIWNKELTSAEIIQLYGLQSNPNKFTWSTSDSIPTSKITVNTNTKVWLKVTDGIGTCYDTTNIFVSAKQATIGSDTIRSCATDSVKLKANSGFKTYQWSNGALLDSTFVKSTGTFILSAKDSIGCLSYDTAIVSVLNPKILPRDTVVCKNVQITLRSSVNASSSANTSCGYMPSSLKTGLVAWYPFCGNANDGSGNGYNGVPNNGAALTSDYNNINTAAYNFDGVDDVINTSLPYTKLLRSKGFSVSAWIKLGTSTTFYSYSIVNNMNPSATQFWMGLEGTQNNGANHRKPTLFFNSFNGGSQAVIVPNYTVQTNTWTHLTFTLKNNTFRFYANGVLTYTKSVNFDSLSTEAPAPNVKIGRGNLTPGFYQDFNGSIDEVGIWNRALSGSEVQRLYSCADPIKLTWSTSDTTQTTKVTVNSTTKVWLKATDGVGVCYDTANIILSQPALPLNDTTLFTACQRDSMLLNVGSKWNNVLWSNGDKDSSTYLATTGKYFLQAKDQYGCLATDSTYFVNPGKPKIQTIMVDSVNCFAAKDGGVKCTYSGGFTPYKYQWNDVVKQSTPNAYNLSKGTYKVVVSDYYNCKDSATATVYEPLRLQVKLVSTDSVNCFGGSDGSIKVSVSGGSNGYAYLWNDPLKQKTATASGLSKGTYKVNVKDIYGCSDSLSADVLEPLKVKVVIQSFANAKCFGYTNGSALANASGGTGQLKYTWNTSPTQSGNVASNLGEGVYQVRAVDAYGCFDTASVNINEPPKIVPLISGNRLAVRDILHELSATVTPAQTYTYSWTPSSVFGKNTNTAVKNGKFYTTTLVTLRTTDANGCFGEDTATITVLIPFADFIPTGFSPNADKHNDVFGLPDLFETEQLDVYDRWGALLFKGSKDQPTWDGTYGGEYVPTGSYMYIIKARLKGTIYKFEHKGTIGVLR